MIFWKREAICVYYRQVSTKQLELETAKEILSEIFHARPENVESIVGWSNAVVVRSTREKDSGLLPSV